MKSCYEIYPEEYFPQSISLKVCDGRFPPDIEGEYEMVSPPGDGTYEFYMAAAGVYKPLTTYPAKSMYIIIEGQVNGRAKVRYSNKINNPDYKEWTEVDAYIYGDVNSNNSDKDFIICYDNIVDAGDYEYYMGNIIKGTIDISGIYNIETWSVIKDRNPDADLPGIYKVGGYKHYSAGFAERKK